MREYLGAYLDAVARVDDPDLERRQAAPYASLGEGAAGTSYALWRLGERRRASIWLSHALADRRRAAFHTTLAPSTRQASTLFGRTGVRWVAALVSGGDHLDTYARSLEAGCARLEFASGSAGQLLGALILLRQRPHQRVERAAARLAHRLEQAARRRGRRAWQTRDATGFAHRWPGIFYAILAWHRFKGTPVPVPVVEALRHLAAAWSPHVIANPLLEASWCNGAAGATLLWARTYDCTGDPHVLRVARRAVRAAFAASGRASTLCCGDAGVAYASLAMARIDDGARWRELATALCARTIRNAAMPWPFGLFQGHAGLACLAHDCLGRPLGFPAVDT